MRVLIIATNSTPAGLAAEVRAGKHQRVDYLELAERFNSEYLDYNRLPARPLVQRFEDLLRSDLRLAANAARLVRQKGYDCVISLSERVGVPLALLLDRRVRHIVIFHHGMSPKKLRLIKAMRLQRRWDIIAAISRAEAEGMRAALDLEPERVVALHTPVDTRFYQPDGLSSGVEGFIQSLGLSYRDYPTLIRAMRRLPHIPCQLRVGSTWVSGRGGHEQEPLPANISVEPFVHPHRLRECYAASRFIIVPIRATTQWSAGCTSVQAAQAMGKPVVATRMPGLSEYVVEGETGLLVNQGDDRSMAEAIDTLWNEPQRVVRMGRQARQWMQENFSLDAWLQRVESLAWQVARQGVRYLSVFSCVVSAAAALA